MSPINLKIILMGSSKDEMVAFFKPFIKNKFSTDYKLSIGTDILTKEIKLSLKQHATLTIWLIDQHFKPIHGNFDDVRPKFYKGAAGIIIAFDVANASTFIEAKKLHAEVKDTIGVIPLLFIGYNVEQLENIGEVIDRKEAHHFAENNNGNYIETTKVRGEGVNEALLEFTKYILRYRKEQESDSP